MYVSQNTFKQKSRRSIYDTESITKFFPQYNFYKIGYPIKNYYKLTCRIPNLKRKFWQQGHWNG